MWAGGTCPRFAWAGGTFFPVVLLCQFLVPAGNRFWLYILRDHYYDRKKKDSVVCLAVCAVVSVFGSGDYDRKKKSYSRLSGGLCCCVSFRFWRLGQEKKKFQSSLNLY